ncbi:U4/U6-U5 snRNP complex subunit lsm6 [Meyerozyma guilliermondii]
MAEVEASGAPSDGKVDPSKFLSYILHSAVMVKLHNGVQYRGKLQSIDGYMNIVLENTKEFIDGSEIRSYGDVFIRGNNGKLKKMEKELMKLKKIEEY